MLTTKKYIDELTYRILGCAIEVHKQLGPGLLESIYEKCFVHELSLKGMYYEAQRSVPLNYKGIGLDAELRLDVLVENLIVAELKSIEGILSIHQAVVLTYMRMLEKPKGIIINFNCTNIFREGQMTLINDIYRKLPDT
jgi:GxxExxY protein